MRAAFSCDGLTSGMPGSSYAAILGERLPEDTLPDFGQGNTIVVSLWHRLSAMHLDTPFDMAFLWMGVNDLLQTDRWAGGCPLPSTACT